LPILFYDKPLHLPDFAVFNIQGYRFYELSFQITKLPNHITKKVSPGFGPVKTVCNILMKAKKFIKKVVNIVLLAFIF